MLTSLHIRDLAVIEELELTFGTGMTVLTGETGAGKSILIDALGLILGDRGESALIRDGAERSEIVATFQIASLAAVHALLDEQAIDCDDNELTVRRVIGRDGRSRVYLNGSQIPVQVLKDLGEHLVDIHGQHAHQSLMKRPAQRALLDAHAGHEQLLAELAGVANDWKQVEARLAEASRNPEGHEAEIALLEYQTGELEELSPQPGELEELEEEYRRLANTGLILERGQAAIDILAEGEYAVERQLQQAIQALGDMEKFEPDIGGLVETLDGARIQIDDALDDLRKRLERIDTDPERLQGVERRLDRLHDIARKHHIPTAGLPAHLQTLRDRLDVLVRDRDALGKLEAERVRLREIYRELAYRLHQGRVAAATTMAEEISAQLKHLGLGGGRVLIEVHAREDDQPMAEGSDDVEILISLNPGIAPGPLRKIASGGELSRISLAIQIVAREARTCPVLIFDEVDAGIGGGIAEIVGQQLKSLAVDHQVLCVTHLPQVAAQGDHHLQVSKSTDGTTTHTRVEVLDAAGRIEEIARMLGGVRISEQTRAHAREMLGLDRATSRAGQR